MDSATKQEWAFGLAMFAGLMLIIIGLFQSIAGGTAIFNDKFYAATRNYVFEWDATAWGWVHLLVGVLLFAAGWAVFAGMTWARVVAIGALGASAVANFLSLPAYPAWAIMIIMMDVVCVWALTVYMRPYRED
ncbi:hypothetical protein ACGFNU_44675 [Spirillospora sp. NPDC048911]|uniref:DUF7144 family membrane protein n=1 Tax=Spirillospora sp. NPDC048911 TaxID=3364527 RepID=UPI0037184CB5